MKKAYILFVCLIVTIASVFVVKQRFSKETKTADEPVLSVQNIESKFECPVDGLRIKELPDYARDNETVKKILTDNCFWGTTKLVNIDQDGVDEILLETVGYGCASCHAQDMYIIDGDKVTFSYSGEDLEFKLTDGGFSIIEPIRKSNEAYCCPSEKIKKEFRYSEHGYENIGEVVIKSTDVK